MKYCTRCVLPETFPGIAFNEKGVCRFCQAAKTPQSVENEKSVYLDKFKALIAQVKGKSDYDCTVSFSGGKDSTYTLYLCKKVFGLRPLALVLDNGFISEQALQNIRQTAEYLGVDCTIVKPDFQILKKVFRYATANEMYSQKSLERASTICTSCIGLVKFIFLKTAIEKKIPLMAWGWSPGQAPIRSSIMRVNPALFKATQKTVQEPMRQAAGSAVDVYFLSDDYFKDADAFPYNVSPLAFLEYNEEKIIAKISEFGWKAPEDVDTNSTNCLLNSFANRIHIDRYGYNPYAFEIAEMVRNGVMTREEGMKKMSDSGSAATAHYAENKIMKD